MATTPVRSYRDLHAWQRSIELVTAVYSATRPFPHDERFGLTSQLRRAAVSVSANIAEGHGRLHRAEYRHHVGIARGSLFELETRLIISQNLQYLTNTECAPCARLAREVGQMLTRLGRALK